MKAAFLYSGPHPTHSAWAESINAEFISNDLGKIRIPNISRLIKTLKILKDIPDVDLLLCESGAEIIAGALWKRKHPDKKLVLIVTDPKIVLIPGMISIKRKLYLWALLHCDLLIPTSDFMKRHIPYSLQEKSKIVYPYVEDRYRFSKPIVLKNKKNVVFVGRVGKEKGVDRIVDAFKLLKKNFPMSQLYIVGDGPLRKKLKKQEEKIILAGELSDPMEYFLKGSIYINLARVEPFGVAILEAMCLGLVPIVTENVGMADFVKKVSPKLIVRNEVEAAEFAKKLWTSPELHREYSSKCIEIAREFSKKSSIHKFKRVISELYTTAVKS